MNILKWLFSSRSERREKVKKIIQVVENLKKGIDSEEALLITRIIPGEWDGELRFKISFVLAQVLMALHLSQTHVTYNGVKQAGNILKDMDTDGRNLYYKAIAADMTARMLKVDYDAAADMAEEEYQKFKLVVA